MKYLLFAPRGHFFDTLEKGPSLPPLRGPWAVKERVPGDAEMNVPFPDRPFFLETAPHLRVLPAGPASSPGKDGTAP